ncbi:ABC transporter ATP-binding protein, partial [Acidobacteriota bacterium]
TSPSKGSFEINGRLTALLELGAGFHHLLTGKENVYLNGLILGMSKKEVDKKFDEIVTFADIGDFIDQPVKNYSSGMFVRLGFSVAIHMNPEIMVVDEVLSVGDIRFQRKCQEKIREFQKGGGTILFVSHDMDLVYSLCQRVIFLHRGEMEAEGPTEEVIRLFWQKWLTERSPDEIGPFRYTTDASPEIQQADKRWGNAEAEIMKFEMRDDRGEKAKVLRSGDKVSLNLEYRADTRIERAVFDVTIFSHDGTIVSNLSSRRSGDVMTLHGDGALSFNMDYLPLTAGEYQVSAQITNEDFSTVYDHIYKFYGFTVLSTGPFQDRGLVVIPGHWTAGRS